MREACAKAAPEAPCVEAMDARVLTQDTFRTVLVRPCPVRHRTEQRAGTGEPEACRKLPESSMLRCNLLWRRHKSRMRICIFCAECMRKNEGQGGCVLAGADRPASLWLRQAPQVAPGTG